MSGNFTNSSSVLGVYNVTSNDGFESSVPSRVNTTGSMEIESQPPNSSTAAALFHNLLTKSAQIMEKALPATTETLTEVMAAGNHSSDSASAPGSVSPSDDLPSTTTAAQEPTATAAHSTTVLEAITSAAVNVTQDVLTTLAGTNTSNWYEYDEYHYDSEEDYAMPPVQPPRHYNKTLWRGEVDHHMVNMDYEEGPHERYNDVIYVIVVVIFYGAVLVLAFVIQMRRRNHYNDIDSEHFNEYLHMKWDVLEKKRLLGKERVGKMRCLVDAPNVAFIPEQSV